VRLRRPRRCKGGRHGDCDLCGGRDIEESTEPSENTVSRRMMVLRISIMIFSLESTSSVLRAPAQSTTRGFQPGRFAKREVSPCTSIHGNASSRKISRPGFAMVGSSNVPTFRIITPGRAPGSSARAAFRAEVPQDRIAAAAEASERFECAFNSHRLFGRPDQRGKGAASEFWQSRQWHTVALVGSASAV